MSGELSILCTGDLHLGRRPTRVPPELDGEAFSPRAVWRSTVDEAIDSGVDAVAITGDVVDRENRYFEAYGGLEEGVTRLDDAGIPVVAVAGNHDFDVLPRMVADLDVDGLHLLGEEGNWERTTISRDGDPLVHFDGWSFGSEHVLNSPLDGYDLPAESDAPLIGILHADLDAEGSEYAPVKTAHLRGTPADAWLLGHVHSPGVRVEADPFVFYPGSPQALDPGEPGSHGPWLLTLDAGRVDAEQRPLARVRYDRFEVDVGGAEDAKAIPPLVSEQIRDHVRTDVATGPVELLLARVRLTGRTEAHADVVDRRSDVEDQLALKEGSVPIRVEALEVDTRPDVDLEELARGESPVAYLADLLLDLESGDVSDEYAPLVDDAVDAMERAHAAPAFSQLRREDRVARPDEDDALATLESQVRVLLDALLAQTEASA